MYRTFKEVVQEAVVEEAADLLDVGAFAVVEEGAVTGGAMEDVVVDEEEGVITRITKDLDRMVSTSFTLSFCPDFVDVGVH
mmetsp:Transcript_16091/g.21037  ORF Transcript_16091/g.21037 Transcript_16091/m.21037 type:complete len:81 (+) Transcript_16091:371-613(+)